MAATETLESLLRDSFPDATEVAVEDRTGGGDHFQVTIASGRFEGLSLVEQHRLVYEALAAPPAVECGGVTDDSRRERGKPIGRARGPDVGGVHGVCRRRVGKAIDR